MYYFRDTVENSVSDSLPAEAMQFNGSYLENLVTGYRTLSVEGREAGSCEIIETDRTREHGSIYRGKRYGPRNLRVHFKLEAPDAATFESRFTTLNGILDAEQAELIFDDEPNVYYTGTKTGIYGVRPGALAVTGTIEFHCTDPFKRRTTDEILRSTAETMTITYNGTQPVRPIVEAFLSQNTGYIAYTLNGATLEIGDKSAEDPFTAGTARAVGTFSAESGEMVDGEAAMQAHGYLSFAANIGFSGNPEYGADENVYLILYNSTLDATAISITISPNEADENFTVTFTAYNNVTLTFTATFEDSTTVAFKLAGLEFTAIVGDEAQTATINENSVAGLNITEMGGSAGYSLQIFDATLYDYDSEDDMNLAVRGDTVKVDAQNAMITRSGVDMQSEGSIYNNFEGFALKPGENTLTVAYSSWSTAPRTTVKWREAFI